MNKYFVYGSFFVALFLTVALFFLNRRYDLLGGADSPAIESMAETAAGSWSGLLFGFVVMLILYAISYLIAKRSKKVPVDHLFLQSLSSFAFGTLAAVLSLLLYAR